MHLLTFRSPTGDQLGIKVDRGVIDVAAAKHSLGDDAPEQLPASIQALCTGGIGALHALKQLVERTHNQPEHVPWLVQEGDLAFGPCVPRCGKIICVGLNYRQHAAESRMAVPDSPVLFPKYANSLAGSGEVIVLPPNAVEFDYEAELAVVIGRRARYVREEEALAFVLGYCNANDLSARDLQFRTSQWMLGKALDGFLPLGPYLVTANEVPDPQSLRIRCWVNGELRQDATTAEMIFPVASLISYLSQYLTLEPGDVIVTGTPEGVILGKSGVPWLTAGDEVSVEVGELGRLTNTLFRMG